MPISGRAGAMPTLESQEAYPPARSTASAGYAALCEHQFDAVFVLAPAVGVDGDDVQQPIEHRRALATLGTLKVARDGWTICGMALLEASLQLPHRLRVAK